MTHIPGYSITDTVYEDPFIAVVYAISESTSKLMLLKIVKSGNRITLENAKLIHEYNFLSDLDMEGLLKPASYMNFKNMMILEYEPVNAVTLRDYYSNPSTLSAESVLILQNTAKRLQELHDRNILHLNIRPDTLLIQQATNQIFLTGFGYATYMNQEGNQGQSSLEGNPIYMSPEQTGRMDFALDARADIYSLGITLYELFSTRLPFSAKGALDWAFAHLAQKPVALYKLNQDLPLYISDIIMKMLAKDPEQRYPNMNAILEDLDLQLTTNRPKSSIKLQNRSEQTRAIRVPAVQEHKAMESSSHDTLIQAHRTPLVISEYIVGYPQVLDLAAVVQASQVFADEPNGGRIAERLIQLIIKHAGAQRGLLITSDRNHLYVKVEARLEGNHLLSKLQRVPLEDYSNIRRDIISIAYQSREIMQGAGIREASGPTTISEQNFKSGIVLCLPILKNDQFHGLLYLENRLTHQSFASERIHVTRNLTSQALLALRAEPSGQTALEGGYAAGHMTGLDGHIIKPSLTRREMEVLSLLSKGFSNKEIAATLTIGSETAKTHLKNIFEKLKVDRRMKAVAVAKTIGLLEQTNHHE